MKQRVGNLKPGPTITDFHLDSECLPTSPVILQKGKGGQKFRNVAWPRQAVVSKRSNVSKIFEIQHFCTVRIPENAELLLFFRTSLVAECNGDVGIF